MEEEKMADKIRVLLGEEEVNKRINEVARKEAFAKKQKEKKS